MINGILPKSTASTDSLGAAGNETNNKKNIGEDSTGKVNNLLFSNDSSNNKNRKEVNQAASTSASASSPNFFKAKMSSFPSTSASFSFSPSDGEKVKNNKGEEVNDDNDNIRALPSSSLASFAFRFPSSSLQSIQNKIKTFDFDKTALQEKMESTFQKLKKITLKEDENKDTNKEKDKEREVDTASAASDTTVDTIITSNEDRSNNNNRDEDENKILNIENTSNANDNDNDTTPPSPQQQKKQQKQNFSKEDLLKLKQEIAEKTRERYQKLLEQSQPTQNQIKEKFSKENREKCYLAAKHYMHLFIENLLFYVKKFIAAVKSTDAYKALSKKKWFLSLVAMVNALEQYYWHHLHIYTRKCIDLLVDFYLRHKDMVYLTFLESYRYYSTKPSPKSYKESKQWLHYVFVNEGYRIAHQEWCHPMFFTIFQLGKVANIQHQKFKLYLQYQANEKKILKEEKKRTLALRKERQHKLRMLKAGKAVVDDTAGDSYSEKKKSKQKEKKKEVKEKGKGKEEEGGKEIKIETEKEKIEKGKKYQESIEKDEEKKDEENTAKERERENKDFKEGEGRREGKGIITKEKEKEIEEGEEEEGNKQKDLIQFYTDENFRLKQEMHLLEDKIYLLRKEKHPLQDELIEKGKGYFYYQVWTSYVVNDILFHLKRRAKIHVSWGFQSLALQLLQYSYHRFRYDTPWLFKLVLFHFREIERILVDDQPWWMFAMNESYFQMKVNMGLIGGKEGEEPELEETEEGIKKDDERAPAAYWEEEEDVLGNFLRKDRIKKKRKGQESDEKRSNFFPVFYSPEKMRTTDVPHGKKEGTEDLRKLADMGANKFKKWIQADMNIFDASNAPKKSRDAIRFYSEQLRRFNPMAFPSEWAFVQYQLAVNFVKNGEGVVYDLGCLDNAVYHLTNALQVYKKELNPRMHCVCLISYGRVLLRRVKEMAHVESLDVRRQMPSYQFLAIDKLEEATKAIDKEDFPTEFCAAHMAYAQALLYKRDNDRATSCDLAMDAIEEVPPVMATLEARYRRKKAYDVSVNPITTDKNDQTHLQHPSTSTMLPIKGLVYLYRENGDVEMNLDLAEATFKQASTLWKKDTKQYGIINMYIGRVYAERETLAVDDLVNLPYAVKYFNIAATTFSDIMEYDYTDRELPLLWLDCEETIGRLFIRGWKETYEDREKVYGDDFEPTGNPDYLPSAILHLEKAKLRCRPDHYPSPYRFCRINEALAEAYILYAFGTGYDTANISSASDYLLNAMIYKNRITSPRDYLLFNIQLAELKLRNNRFYDVIMHYRDIYDSVGFLLNAKRFHWMDQNRRPRKIPGSPELTNHLKPSLYKGIECLVACILQQRKWPALLENSRSQAQKLATDKDKNLPLLTNKYTNTHTNANTNTSSKERLQTGSASIFFCVSEDLPNIPLTEEDSRWLLGDGNYVNLNDRQQHDVYVGDIADAHIFDFSSLETNEGSSWKRTFSSLHSKLFAKNKNTNTNTNDGYDRGIASLPSVKMPLWKRLAAAAFQGSIALATCGSCCCKNCCCNCCCNIFCGGCCGTWYKPSFESIVTHPLLIECLAMYYRIGQASLVESAGYWKVDDSLRFRRLLRFQLGLDFYWRKLRPIWMQIKERTWALEDDLWSSVDWSYFSLQPQSDKWKWREEHAMGHEKLVNRLQHLENIIMHYVYPLDSIYPLFSCVRTSLPLSLRDIDLDLEAKRCFLGHEYESKYVGTYRHGVSSKQLLLAQKSGREQMEEEYRLQKKYPTQFMYDVDENQTSKYDELLQYDKNTGRLRTDGKALSVLARLKERRKKRKYLAEQKLEEEIKGEETIWGKLEVYDKTGQPMSIRSRTRFHRTAVPQSSRKAAFTQARIYKKRQMIKESELNGNQLFKSNSKMKKRKKKQQLRIQRLLTSSGGKKEDGEENAVGENKDEEDGDGEENDNKSNNDSDSEDSCSDDEYDLQQPSLNPKFLTKSNKRRKSNNKKKSKKKKEKKYNNFDYEVESEDEDLVSSVENFLLEDLHPKEAVLHLNRTESSVIINIIYKDHPPPNPHTHYKPKVYEKERRKSENIQLIVKCLLLGTDVAKRMENVVDQFMKCIHLKDRYTDNGGKRQRFWLGEFAELIKIPDILVQLPPQTEVLTFIPSGGIEVIPLHCLPLPNNFQTKEEQKQLHQQREKEKQKEQKKKAIFSSSKTKVDKVLEEVRDDDNNNNNTNKNNEIFETTLFDHFDFRYTSSLATLHIWEKQFYHGERNTPWHYCHLNIMGDPRVVIAGKQPNLTPGAREECQLITENWTSNPDVDISTLTSTKAKVSKLKTIFQEYEVAPPEYTTGYIPPKEGEEETMDRDAKQKKKEAETKITEHPNEIDDKELKKKMKEAKEKRELEKKLATLTPKEREIEERRIKIREKAKAFKEGAKADMKAEKLKGVVRYYGEEDGIIDAQTGLQYDNDDDPVNADPYEKRGLIRSFEQHLTRCRALHICAPMLQFPRQGLLFTPENYVAASTKPPSTGLSSPLSSDGEGNNENDKLAGIRKKKKKEKWDPTKDTAPFTGEDILRQLDLQHCGLVTLSRAGVMDCLYDWNQFQGNGTQVFELADAFMAAGAKSCIQPMWDMQDDFGLTAILIMPRMYEFLIDAMKTPKPVAAALRAATLWIRELTCKEALEYFATLKLSGDVRVKLEDNLYCLADRQTKQFKEVKEMGEEQEEEFAFRTAGFNQNPMLFHHKPFRSPFYWGRYRAIGSCKGVHRDSLTEISDSEDSDDPAYQKKYGGFYNKYVLRRKPDSKKTDKQKEKAMLWENEGKFKWVEMEMQTDSRRNLAGRVAQLGKNIDDGIGLVHSALVYSGEVATKVVSEQYEEHIGKQIKADNEVLDYLDWQSQVDSMFINSHPTTKERRTINKLGQRGGYEKPSKNLEEEDMMAQKSIIYRAKKKNDEVRETSRKNDAEDLYSQMRKIERTKKKKKKDEDLTQEEADKLSKFF